MMILIVSVKIDAINGYVKAVLKKVNKHEKRQQNPVGEEIWFCCNCLDFPFRNITNESLISLFEENNRVIYHINLKNFNPLCSICDDDDLFLRNG